MRPSPIRPARSTWTRSGVIRRPADGAEQDAVETRNWAAHTTARPWLQPASAATSGAARCGVSLRLLHRDHGDGHTLAPFPSTDRASAAALAGEEIHAVEDSPAGRLHL